MERGYVVIWRHKTTRAPDLGARIVPNVPQFGAKTAENPGIRGGTLLALVQNHASSIPDILALRAACELRPDERLQHIHE